MKKIIFLLPTILLTGCLSTPPVIPPWPDVPKELLAACPDLKRAQENDEKLSDLLETVVDNYQTYYDCKSKVDDWIVWYKEQQKIRNTFK